MIRHGFLGWIAITAIIIPQLGCASSPLKHCPCVTAHAARVGHVPNHAVPPISQSVTPIVTPMRPLTAPSPTTVPAYEYRALPQPDANVYQANSFVPRPTPQDLGTRNIPTQSDTPMDYGRDYSWLRGTLEYSNVRGGMWKVRYAPLSIDDPYGGSVVLDSDPTEAGLKNGDIVLVEGKISRPNGRPGLPTPLYQVQNIRRLDVVE